VFGLTALIALLPLAGLSAQSPAADLSEEVQKFVAVDAPVVALTGVRVVDGTGVEPRENQTIVIRDGRIAAVGPDGEVGIPGDAEVLDREGHTVLPGFVGLHNHILYTVSGRWTQLSHSAPRLYLASGVTTVRTTGSFVPYDEINLKQEIEAGRVPGPAMFVTGPFLTGPEETRWRQMSQVEGSEDARRLVEYWAEEEGVGWFKAYTRISREALGAAIEEAHRRGAKVTGHLCSVTFTEAVELGIDNIEHGFGTNTGWYPDKEPDACPDDRAEEVAEHLARLDVDSPEVETTIRTMVDNDVALTSTLAVAEHSVPDRPPLDRLERTLDVMADEAREGYLETREQIDERGPEEIWSDEIFANTRAFERKFHEAGGLLAAGVDPTGIGGALPGFGDQRNYELLIESGFDPVTAVEIMTANGARVLGIYDEVGSIEEGKRADLVLIDGNPVENPGDIRSVETVFKEGVGYDSRKLIDAVEGVVGVR
jgi:imidazolonepropionase-like amidohydrolase